MRLPIDFTEEMARLWADYAPEGTFDEFLAAHEQPSASGIRANLLKLSPEELKTLLPDLVMNPVPWASSGFYTAENSSPGRLPHYHAGLFYIQEPSAMLPAEMMGVMPGEKVLDLCAAPGGKSTRLAGGVGPEGLLWANEINADRAKALLRNLELSGSDRTVITQETPERLADHLPHFFDRILVDAPCSGSGMFRRDPQAAGSWERFGPVTCIPVQAEILEAADQMLAPGGCLVYSTCSFSLAEDESMIQQFLLQHPDYQIEDGPDIPGLSPGLHVTQELTKSVRIWPHRARGDGHYCAKLHKKFNQKRPDPKTGLTQLEHARTLDCFKSWADATFSVSGQKKLLEREQNAFYRNHMGRLHLVPDVIDRLEGLHWVKTGLYLGQIHEKSSHRPKQTRLGNPRISAKPLQIFEPAHALALTLQADDFRYALRLNADDPLLIKYLRGETIAWPEDRWEFPVWPEGAFVAVCLDRFPLGWSKAQGRGQLKNLYPPGWRKMN